MGMKGIYKKSMCSSLQMDAKPATIEIMEDRNTVEKEMQAVKIILETGELYKEMDTEDNICIEFSKYLEMNSQGRYKR